MIQMPSNLNDLRATWRLVNKIDTTVNTGSFGVKNSGDTTSFYVYDIIGAVDGQAESFVKEVAATRSKEINLFINSMGGFVWDALSMYDSLLSASQRVHVVINGLAASAASFLAMAGDTVKITEAGRMMIHDAQGVGVGSPADMREYADLLDSVSDDISGIYARRAGGDPKTWRKSMSKTTWYNSTQAIDAGLADELTTAKKGPDNRTRLIQARMASLKKGL